MNHFWYYLLMSIKIKVTSMLVQFSHLFLELELKNRNASSNTTQYTNKSPDSTGKLVFLVHHFLSLNMNLWIINMLIDWRQKWFREQSKLIVIIYCLSRKKWIDILLNISDFKYFPPGFRIIGNIYDNRNLKDTFFNIDKNANNSTAYNTSLTV